MKASWNFLSHPENRLPKYSNKIVQIQAVNKGAWLLAWFVLLQLTGLLPTCLSISGCHGVSMCNPNCEHTALESCKAKNPVISTFSFWHACWSVLNTESWKKMCVCVCVCACGLFVATWEISVNMRTSKGCERTHLSKWHSSIFGSRVWPTLLGHKCHKSQRLSNRETNYPAFKVKWNKWNKKVDSRK